MSNVDIKITGIDTNNVGRPRNDGTQGSALYAVPFRLSQSAPSEWCDIFEQLWKGRFTQMARPAEAGGNYIVITKTTLEEVEEYHKEDLKTLVDETNKHYNAHVEAQQDAERKRQAEDQRVREEIESKAKKVNEGWND